jgi:hypothetical protein
MKAPTVTSSEGVVGILHGVAIEDEGLIGLLEESTRQIPGITSS